MSKRQKSSPIELQLAIARWLVYLASAVAFLLVWLLDPQQVSASIASTPVLVLLAIVLFFNLLLTLFALLGWLKDYLPLAGLIGDVVVVAAAYFVLVPVPTPLSAVVDPLFLLVLFPVMTASLFFHWSAGLLVAVVLGALRALLLLWGLPEPFAPGVFLPALFGLFFLAGLASLSGYLVGEEHRIDFARVAKKARRAKPNESPQASLREEALQHISGTLEESLNFEKVLESALDVTELEMQRWGVKGQLAAIIFLYRGTKLEVAEARKLPRYELDEMIPGEAGVVAECLSEAEPVVGGPPQQDPELIRFTGLANCQTSVAIPLRVGFERYGAVLFATPAFPTWNEEHIEFFEAVAARASISLHNALLYQSLQQERDRIVRIEEDARHKLARDLHDGPTQGVSAIAMRVNFVRKMLLNEPEQLQAELEAIEQMARQTVKEIRHMLFTMRPLVLETQGLVSALQALVDKIQEMADLNIRINEVGDASSYLDAKQASVVFYIIEEALGNARKYSQASLVEVNLWIESDLFVAQIADDGVGFDTGEVLGDYESRGSLGMINMRERAELVDGSLDVQSTPNKGTTITALVPLRKRVGAA